MTRREAVAKAKEIRERAEAARTVQMGEEDIGKCEGCRTKELRIASLRSDIDTLRATHAAEVAGLRETISESNAAIVEYLEWGPMTGSDRDYLAQNLKRVVEIAKATLSSTPSADIGKCEGCRTKELRIASLRSDIDTLRATHAAEVAGLREAAGHAVRLLETILRIGRFAEGGESLGNREDAWEVKEELKTALTSTPPVDIQERKAEDIISERLEKCNCAICQEWAAVVRKVLITHDRAAIVGKGAGV